MRVVINLAPADVRKEGPSFDLPIALALQLRASCAQASWGSTAASVPVAV